MLNMEQNTRLIGNVTDTLATGDETVKIPDYLRDVYSWAYINPLGVRILDHDWIVNTVLWGYAHRLQQALFDEIKPGQRVLQSCCVYGSLTPRLARHLGDNGHLDVIDVAPVQVESCRRKLDDSMNATAR